MHLRLRALAAILIVSLVAACSSSGGGGNGGLSAQALSDKAIGVFQTASSVHVHGRVTDSGQTTTIDLHLGKDSGTGTLTVGGSPLKLLAVGGTTYFQGTDAFYKQVVPAAKQATVLPKLPGKWIRVPAGDPNFGSLTSFTTKTAFVHSILSSSTVCRKCKRGDDKTVDGVAAVSFIDQKEGTTVYVDKSGLPYPVRIDHSGGSLHFDSWNATVHASAPAASDVVELSELTG